MVNLIDIQKKAGKEEVIDLGILRKLNLIKDEKKLVKVLAKLEGNFDKKITFKADKFSLKAKEIIEAAGGSAECLNR